MRLRAPLTISALSASLLLAPAAHAEESAHDRAVTNFEAGRRMLEQGDCLSALPRFLESLRAEPSVGARFSAATCAKSQGALADAWNHYKGAEQLALAKGDKERSDLARREAATLEPQVLKLRVALPERASITVAVDGVPVPTFDLLLLQTGYAVRPNEPHVIRATEDNHAPWKRDGVQGAPGAELPPFIVDMGPPLHTPGPPPDPTRGRTQRIVGLATAGAGVAGLGVGALFGLVAMEKKSDYDAAVANPANGCGPDRQTCGPAVKTARDAIDGPATISTVAFVAGGVLTVGGAALYLFAPRAEEPAKTPVVTGFVGPTGGAIGLRGAF